MLGRVLGLVQMHRAIDAGRAVLNANDVLVLRDPIRERLESPVEQDVGRLAAQPRIVGRGRVEALGRAPPGFRQRQGARPRPGRSNRVVRRRLRRAARARKRAPTFGHGAGLQCVGHADRHERAADAAPIRHHALLTGPIAVDVRIAIREPLGPIGGHGRRLRLLPLPVPVHARAVGKRDRAEIAGVRLVAIGHARDVHLRSRGEHLLAPTGAAQDRRRTHLATPLGGLAVRPGHVHVQPRVRVDERELRDGAVDRDVFVEIEVGDAVMRRCIRGKGSSGDQRQSTQGQT